MSTNKTKWPVQNLVSIGVLDIQGSVEEHMEMLKRIGISVVAVKKPADLEGVSGLIIPGGESTTIGKLMNAYGLDRAIRERATKKKHPLCIWGTCAGAILIAKKVYNRAPDNLNLMDIAIERNAYGRQIDSFRVPVVIPNLGEKPFPAVFIRAPKVTRTSKQTKILAEYQGSPVMLEENQFLATMFHPELTQDARVHEYFVSLTSRYAL